MAKPGRLRIRVDGELRITVRPPRGTLWILILILIIVLLRLAGDNTPVQVVL
jgi:hypothetical protein